jgi:hypothetical protein
MRKKFLRVKDIVNLVQNKTTKQYSYNLKKRQSEHWGISPKGFLNVKIPIKDKDIEKRKKERTPIW